MEPIIPASSRTSLGSLNSLSQSGLMDAPPDSSAPWSQKNRSFLNKLWVLIYRPSSPFASPTREQFNDDDSEKIVVPAKMKSLSSMNSEELKSYQSVIKAKFSAFQESKLKGHARSFAERLLEIYIISESKRDFHKRAQVLKPENIDEADMDAISDHFEGKIDEILFLKKEYGNFNYSYKKAEKEALRLHLRFQFLYPHSSVSIDPESNQTTLTYEQLKVALKMAKDCFPQLLDGMWHEHFVPKVTRLIQIILVGEKALVLPIPVRPTIFALKELQGIQSTPKLREIAHHCCFLFHHVFNFENHVETPAVSNLTGEEGKNRFKKIVTQFTSDSLIRTGNKLKINGTITALGGNPQASTFALIREGYLNFLRQADSQRIKEVVDLAKNSLLMNMLRTAYEFKGSSWFPLECFAELLENEISSRAGGTDSDYVALLKMITVYAQIDSIAHADVFFKLENGMKRSDLEDLLRFLFLVVIVLGNQNIQGEQTIHFYKQIIEIHPKLLPAMTEERLFEFDGDPAGSFVSRGVMLANLLQEAAHAEGIVETFQQVIPIFQSETVFRVAALMETHHKKIEDHPATITLNRLQFSMKAPKSIIDHVFSVLHVKPYHTLTCEPNINSVLDQLAQIGDQQEGDSIIILRDGTIKVNHAPERLTLSQLVAGGNPYLMFSITSLEARQNAIQLLADQTESAVRDYLIYSLLQEEDKYVVDEKIAEVVMKVIKAQAGLVNIGAPQQCFSRIIKELAE